METFSRFIIQRIKGPNAIICWMAYNPFSDLDISAYRERKRAYEALVVDQLYSFFVVFYVLQSTTKVYYNKRKVYYSKNVISL